MKYEVTFTRTTTEVVQVEAGSSRQARDIVYDSYGQDMETCVSQDLYEVDFYITNVTNLEVRQ